MQLTLQRAVVFRGTALERRDDFGWELAHVKGGHTEMIPVSFRARKARREPPYSS